MNSETANQKQGTYFLLNANEEAVMEAVWDQIKNTRMCKCEKCYKDVCAIVLNDMPPHYVTTRAGMLYHKMPDIGRYADLIVRVTRAIKIVSRAPRH